MGQLSNFSKITISNNMKLIITFLTLASALRRHAREIPAQDANGWNYIDIDDGMQAVLGSGALEGRWYQVGSWANANAGHAFCNSVGGFAPISRMANVQSIYGDLPGLRSPYTYWSGFKKSNEGGWRVFQSANGNTDVRKSLTWCEGDTRGSDDKCARAHPEDGCFKSKNAIMNHFLLILYVLKLLLLMKSLSTQSPTPSPLLSRFRTLLVMVAIVLHSLTTSRVLEAQLI